MWVEAIIVSVTTCWRGEIADTGRALVMLLGIGETRQMLHSSRGLLLDGTYCAGGVQSLSQTKNALTVQHSWQYKYTNFREKMNKMEKSGRQSGC